MHIHSFEKIDKLKDLRKKGHSINEIVEKLSIPKTTVWHHIKKIQVLPQYRAILNAKRGGSAKRKRRNLELAQIKAKEMLTGENRELVIALAMLYWAEGSKKVCEFINSDGEMVKIYLFILRNIIRVPEENIKPTMRIFTGMSKGESLYYWARVTSIPRHRFIVRLNDGGLKSKTKYGMCRITVQKGGNVLKLVHSLIREISQEFLKEKQIFQVPVAQSD